MQAIHTSMAITASKVCTRCNCPHHIPFPEEGNGMCRAAVMEMIDYFGRHTHRFRNTCVPHATNKNSTRLQIMKGQPCLNN